jgi:hypothetical protein
MKPTVTVNGRTFEVSKVSITMATHQEALWPDTSDERHYECWNCGSEVRYLVRGSATRFMCACGCGWSVRFGVRSEIERGQFDLREALLARQLKGGLVDFTQPGAPSAPA